MTMFNGRIYDTIGAPGKDLILKTKGKVKIQLGSKMIDLVKDGKINTDASFIFKGKEVGVRDGIYVLDSGDVCLVAGDRKISLAGEGGTTYVSFMTKQETTSEQKTTAMRNIGFSYETMESLENAKIDAGIVYVEDKSALYIIQDGNISQYSIPIPYKGRFVIENPGAEKGSLVISGTGEYNSLLFDTMCIYSNNEGSYVDLDGVLHIRAGGTDKVSISDNFTEVSNTLITKSIQSNKITDNCGFSLGMKDGTSFLKVDNIFLNGDITDTSGTGGFYSIAPVKTILLVPDSKKYPAGWYPCDGKKRIVNKVTGEEVSDGSGEETEAVEPAYLTTENIIPAQYGTAVTFIMKCLDI